MSISFENALGIHPSALSLRGRRASILADNLANADTPHFRARDIDFYSLVRGEMKSMGLPGVNLAVTKSSHLTAPAFATGDDELLYRIPHQPAVDGNTVEEQVEQAEYTRNALDFQASFQFLDSKFKGLKTAIRGEL